MSPDKSKRRVDDEIKSKDALLHELQVHQIELEMQNQQLREAQQQLEETRDRYADLYDYAPVGYLTLDESGIVQEINLTGAGMLGKERVNIVGQPFINHLATSSIQEFLVLMRKTFTLTGNQVAEIQIKVKQGKPRIVNLESVAMPGNKKTSRVVINDVTDQRSMGVALQVIRSAQEALLSAIPALVFYQDSNLHYLNVSQAFADFVGRKPEDIVGKTVCELFPGDAGEDLHNVSASVLQTGMTLYGFENTLPDAKGTPVCLSTVLAPYRDIHERNIGLVGVSFDISTIKSTSNINSELLIQNRKLTRNLFVAQEEERRHLARELHDELGQWLTAIQAEAQAICNIGKPDPVIHDSAFAISSSAKAIHEVIRNMLRKLRPSLLDELGLTDSLRELQRQWCHSHPDIVCDFELEVLHESLSDELNITIYRLVQEALSNIASHAQASRIKVALKDEPKTEGGTRFVLLSIEDNGTGFDSRLVRAGIGLLGMRERVIASGGEFYIDSTPGLGTQMQARLPITDTGKRK